MKVLHFHATAGHPNVAPALESQVRNTLRPFHRFLKQAIHTAKQRQTRYQLPWERVRNLQSLRLEPMDTILRVPRSQPGFLLVDWPADKRPDLAQPGFIPSRGLPVRFEAAEPTSAGLRVKTEPALDPSADVIWCNVTSQVAKEASATAPSQVLDVRGQPLILVESPRLDEDERHWLLLVEGRHDDCDVVVDGAEFEADALPSFEGLKRVRDVDGKPWSVTDGTLRVEELPPDGPLRSDSGMHFTWRSEGGKGRSGCWVELLPLESSDAEEFLDPRAAFCEGDVREVWTQARRNKDTVFKVKRVDQDRYQLLLDRYPPNGTTLYLPVDVRNLHLQRRALRQLADAPLPHHQGLVRLCEDPNRTRWPHVEHVDLPEDAWRALTDPSRSGTSEQRRFVKKALGSHDFAFLEGPPGSGKTTAICEIVQQLIASGQRVLLCASTHVAIDNVLERLLETETEVDAVRIGRLERVDEKVQATQLDRRVEELVSGWRATPGMEAIGDKELEAMAERTIMMAANLTCGTTMGIVNHPLFRGRDEDKKIWERPIATMPHWDVLIVDEASKTLIQEFMVPALMAKKWIIVGDVRQLPPFADRSDIVANLRELVDDNDKPVFPPDHQRARLLIYRLAHPSRRQRGMRWLIVESPGVLGWVARELEAHPVSDLEVVRVLSRFGSSLGPVRELSLASIRDGRPDALRLAAADWILVGDDLLPEVAPFLPGNMMMASDLIGPPVVLEEDNPLHFRQQAWLVQAGSLPNKYPDRGEEISTFEKAQSWEREWLARHDLAQELAWRLTRTHELKRSRNARERSRLREQLRHLRPYATSIEEPIAEIEDIGLPSILEVLQEGIGADRATRRSALTSGLRATRPGDFEARFESLSFQHRMHSDISAFPRAVVYDSASLKDANTIESRDQALGWDFGSYPARRIWMDVDGREHQGVNHDEIEAMAGVLREFIAWAKAKGPPQRSLPRVWEVACLCFYVKQERGISERLREITQDNRLTRFQVKDVPVEIVCGTVDRFQGREADLVLLSMRNTRRVGFLDSPNRLNVGVTRARQQLIIVGKQDNFAGCTVSELERLAKDTPLVDPQSKGRRGRRR